MVDPKASYLPEFSQKMYGALAWANPMDAMQVDDNSSQDDIFGTQKKQIQREIQMPDNFSGFGPPKILPPPRTPKKISSMDQERGEAGRKLPRS